MWSNGSALITLNLPRSFKCPRTTSDENEKARSGIAIGRSFVEKPLGFGFGVGDDADAPVGLDIEGYDVACGQLSAICAFWGVVIPLAPSLNESGTSLGKGGM